MSQNFLRMIKISIVVFLCITFNQKAFMSTGGTFVGLAICSDPSTIYTNSSNMQEKFGHHSWIALTNMGKNQININGIILPVGKTITISTWNREEHRGIYFNLERYYAQKNEFSHTESVFLIQLLQEFELNLILSKLRDDSIDLWELHNNCATFATRIWNINAKKKITAGIISNPIILSRNILKQGGKLGLILPTPELWYYYSGKNPKAFILNKKIF